MAKLEKAQAQGIIRALRSGTVPSSGLEHFAVGLEKQIGAIIEQLEAVSQGTSDFKFIRGEYGAGKTFLTSLACAEALSRNFVISKVVISNADTPLYKLEEVYRKICQGIEVSGGRKGLKAILDRWLYDVEEQVINTDGIDDEDPRFLDSVDRCVDNRLHIIGEEAGRFAACIKAYHRLQFQDDFINSQGILDWLCGDSKVAQGVKKLAGIKGDIGNADVYAFLRGLLELFRQTGHKGFLVVLDEVETIVRQRSTERLKGLEILRQLIDAVSNNAFKGLYLLITGTPEFYDGQKGVPELTPLHERIKVDFKDHGMDNLRQPQIRLGAFDVERLKLVAEKIVEIYPSDRHALIVQKVNAEFLQGLISQFSQAFRGKIEVTPRLFLRELVDVLDLVDQHDAYDPKRDHTLNLAHHTGVLREEETAVLVPIPS